MFTIPNLLTLLRLLLVPCFIVLSMGGHYGTALVIFVSAALTDVLDGWIARRFNQRSRIGALLDPAADKLLMVSGYLFYTFSAELPVVRIPDWLTFCVFARDVLIVFFAYLLYTRVQVKKFPPLMIGKVSTVLQAVTLGFAILVNAYLPRLQTVAERLFQAALVMTLVSGWIYLRRSAAWVESLPAET